MTVSFVVAGDTYVVPEPQAAILAENLRILAASELSDLADAEPAAELGRDDDWRVEALELANSVEEMLVVESGGARSRCAANRPRPPTAFSV